MPPSEERRWLPGRYDPQACRGLGRANKPRANSGAAEPVFFVVVVGLLFLSARGAGRAVRSVGRRPVPAPTSGAPVGAAARPVLFANPRSGGGKAARFALADQVRRRGIDYVVLGPGSQALVAQVAMERGLAFVCVPVGTRNHFARDLGLDPADVAGALEAYGAAGERRIDVGVVEERVFVNNVSLGVYARIVGTEGYRQHKVPTAWQVLSGVFGPEAQPFDLRFTGPDGQEHTGFHLILVSNGPDGLTADRRFGSRGRLDRGVLGIVAARAGEGEDWPRFAEAWWDQQADPSRGRLQWEASQFEVRSGGATPAGVDGEALVFASPLRFRCLPGALRVRVPGGTPVAHPLRHA